MRARQRAIAASFAARDEEHCLIVMVPYTRRDLIAGPPGPQETMRDLGFTEMRLAAIIDRSGGR